jgi:UDP-N-acetylglucosamine acyltransferase
MIHQTAIIDPQAKLAPTVRVGPYAVIDAGVELGADCVVGPHVYLTGLTTIGPGNHFHAGCVIGDAPQDLKYQGEPTRVRIGERNVFREHVTVNRSATVAGETIVGSGCFLMAGSHVGHNTAVGDHVILANSALLGGHVTVGDRAFISGNCCVHQFVRIGALVMMQGGAVVSQDIPPFCIAYAMNTLCGLNVVGLRRAGWSSAQRLELRRLYQALFRSGQNLRVAVTAARATFSRAEAKQLLDFIATSKRGICTEKSPSQEPAGGPD